MRVLATTVRWITQNARRNQVLSGCALITLMLTLPWASSAKQETNDQSSYKVYKTLPDDGRPWRYSKPKRVVVIPDLHGDFNAYVTILQGMRLIDENGHWIAAPGTIVVQLGDQLDGAPDSRLNIEQTMMMEREAKAKGSNFITLYGNHEMLDASGDLAHMSAAEEERFTGVPKSERKKMQYLAKGAFVSSKSRYAKWLADLPTIVQIDDNVFVHAGLDEWILAKPDTEMVGRINATVRAWVRYWQGVGEEPSAKTRWTVGLGNKLFERGLGPIFHRGFKISEKYGKFVSDRDPEGPKNKIIDKVLKRFGAVRMIVGHAPTPDQRIHMTHPYYGDMVVVADSHMSIAFGSKGRLSALDIDESGNIKETYFTRPTEDVPLRQIWLDRLTVGSCSALFQ